MTQLFSDAYRAQQVEMHRDENYGKASLFLAATVKTFIENTKARSLSDYGAGKCRLKSWLDENGVQGVDYFPYDPAFPDYGQPKAADLVACIDVLEHIEEPFLENVLLDLKAITPKFGFFSIHTGPAMKTLPDGRNTHLIQAPSSWWLPRLCAHFEIGRLQHAPGGFWVFVTPKEERTL